MERPVMYLFANSGLGMSGGKLAAQVAHAAVEAFQNSQYEAVKIWNETGYTKIVLEARDTEHLFSIDRYLTDKGYKGTLIVDEGRTEIPSHTPTALGIEIVDKADPKVQFAFGDFKLYKDPAPRRKSILPLGR